MSTSDLSALLGPPDATTGLPPELLAALLARAHAETAPGAPTGADPLGQQPLEPAPEVGTHLSAPGGSQGYFERLGLAGGLHPVAYNPRARGNGASAIYDLLAGFMNARASNALSQRGERQQTNAASSAAAAARNKERWDTLKQDQAARNARILKLQESSATQTKFRAGQATDTQKADVGVGKGQNLTVAEWLAAKRAKDTAESAGADLAPSLTPEALDQAAIVYGQTGTMIPAGMGKAGIKLREAVANRWGEISSGKGRPLSESNSTIPSNRAAYASDAATLTQLQKNVSAVKAFEATALKNADQMLSVMEKVPDTGLKWLNAPARSIASGLGSADQAAFDASRQVVQNEFARILANPTLAGELSDAARREMSHVMSGGYTRAQFQSALDLLRQDAKNRENAYQAQISETKQRIAHPPFAPAAAPERVRVRGPNGETGTVPAGSPLPTGWQEIQ